MFVALSFWFLLGPSPYNSGTLNAFEWVSGSWNSRGDFEHGWMIPFVSLYMLIHACSTLKGNVRTPSLHGLWLVLLGGVMELVSIRTMQGRFAIAAFPILLTGSIWCYWGRKAAWRCAFPLFFLWLCIPLPGFQQTTVGLQLIATKSAHICAGWFGVETIVEGTNIASADGSWDAFNIAGGCSGIRSLMALIMISVAWAYLADKLALWKRLILGVSAIPLAVFANIVRVASIFIFAEYVNPVFASKTWHDWSGLLFFFPTSLICLTILHGILAGEIPFLKKRKAVIRQNNIEHKEEQ